ncbi:hypothetical protein [Ralstonia solanacearum]|uniref:hypothetical protein n=1 Tax=Ralstonia solanacearum TaxID=305 RepID=UPI0012D7DA78|nr:hypothetical protein [Ralstonia solanacearum]
MSVMMMVEADSRLSESAVLDALSSCGVNDVVSRSNGFGGNFPSSNMFFTYERSTDEQQEIRTEGMRDSGWSVGCRLVFVYVIPHLAECGSQLDKFLQVISDVSEANWVLSFQYESICAVRDENGFCKLREF